MVTQPDLTQVAPGELEDVRELLNTWLIPNDTRTPHDELTEWFAERSVPNRQRSEVRRWRDELRTVVEDSGKLESIANGWVDRYHIVPSISGRQLRYTADSTVAGELAAIVVGAIGDGSFSRLKACPDCRWVFYDNTRNGSKKWCMMNPAGPQSRGCGNIAKARRHRARVRSGG
jgi:hypothetical protein